MSLMQPIMPVGATHKWYHQNGSFRAYLKVNEWVYADDPVQGWVAVAKSVQALSGKVVAL